MSRIVQIQGQIDRLWVELTELRQSLSARPIAPAPGGGDCEFVVTGFASAPNSFTATSGSGGMGANAPAPDYRSDLPADEPCSCEESERLKAELGASHMRIAELEAHLLASDNRRGRLEAKLAAANALLERAKEWVGSMRPHLEAHLASQPAPPAWSEYQGDRGPLGDHG